MRQRAILFAMLLSVLVPVPGRSQEEGRDQLEASFSQIKARIEIDRRIVETNGGKLLVATDEQIRQFLSEARPFIYSTYILNSLPSQGEEVTIGVRVRNSGDTFAFPLVVTLFFGAGNPAEDIQVAIAGRYPDLPYLSSDEFRVDPDQEVSKEWTFVVQPRIAEQWYPFNIVLWKSGSFHKGETIQQAAGFLFVKD